MGTKELRGPSLVETLAGSAHQALDDSLEHAFCLAELNSATAVFAFIDRGQRALANRRPKLAFLYFLNAYVLYPEQDSRLLHWLARAASEQGASSPEGQLHRLADQIQARDVTDDPLPSGATVALRAFGNQPPTPVVQNSNSAEPPPHPVDIIIPVYRGERETLECLRSLIQALPENRTPHQLLVLNDASPEPMLVSALEQLAASVGQLRLIHHPTNLGFIRGVNRAIAVNPERDLVLLNSDARVCGDWLDRLRAWAYCKPDVASVTPFSNHGELMTFPDPRRRYQKPEPADHARLDAFARSVETSEAPVELVVGCGFCMYLRRAAIDAVGPLDETNLLAGYGEDTEWCLRA
ncbi:MAG: glycosyltransferase, partial [Gammaproteobacteria bacterium]|nr:glycosyltransferase [Gammaproteobacteria bacterium]